VCGAGTFAGMEGQAECDPCEPGSFASATGQSSCTECAAGTSASIPGQATCTPCTDGTFAESTGQAECTACTPSCPDGTFQTMACTATSDTGCSDCDASCATCSGPSSTECTSCFTQAPPVEGTCANGCSVGPASGCRPPAVGGKAKLIVKNGVVDSKDLLKWKWTKGSATDVLDFGDPLTTDAYFLCVYDGTTLVSSTVVPADGTCAGKPCWKSTRSGFLYKDRDLTPEGARTLLLKAGAAGRAGVKFLGKGTNLDTPNPATFTGPIRVQLQRATAGVCFEATYSAPFKKNVGGKFIDSAD
jgi:hypothetical protein